jgi:solute carrier family 10 (sodium/bile acid cotransporter), member 7
MKIDRFTLAMLAAIVAALVAPWLGAGDGPLHIGLVTDLGVALIFFLHGIKTSREGIRQGASNWRVHLLIHATTFLVFPAIGFAIFFALAGVLPQSEREGLVYLCVLPSTISSSVAMTSLARGNVPAAIVAATSSGLIGMVATPLLFSLAVSAAGGHGLPIGPALLSIAGQLLLPFVAGHLLRPWLHRALDRHKAAVNAIDRAVIVLIVYGAFCDATEQGVWTSTSPGGLALLLAIALALLLAALSFTTSISRLIGLSKEDEITVVFCGSKKSLANGAPIAKALLGNAGGLAVLLLPLILYHQAQLVIGAMLARRYARRGEDAAAANRAS